MFDVYACAYVLQLTAVYSFSARYFFTLSLSVVILLFDVKKTVNMQLPPIINCVAVCLQVTPSVYTQEMLWSTEERLANTTEVHPPQILELLDMSKTTQHKVNARQCWDTTVA